MIQGAAGRLPPATGLEEAVQLLQGLDFTPTESEPAQIEFNSRPPGLHFHFPTPRACSLVENNSVDGWLYRGREIWHERPTIVFLHGGGDFPVHWLRYPLIFRHPVHAQTCDVADGRSAKRA